MKLIMLPTLNDLRTQNNIHHANIGKRFANLGSSEIVKDDFERLHAILGLASQVLFRSYVVSHSLVFP